MHKLSSFMAFSSEIEAAPRIVSLELLRLHDLSTEIFPGCGLEELAPHANKKASMLKRLIATQPNDDMDGRLTLPGPAMRRMEFIPGSMAAAKRGFSLYKIILPAPSLDTTRGSSSNAPINTLESISLDFASQLSVILKSGDEQLPEVKLEAFCDCPVSLCSGSGVHLVPFVNSIYTAPPSAAPSFTFKQQDSSSSHLLSSNKKLSDQGKWRDSPQSSIRSSGHSDSTARSALKPKGLSLLTHPTIREESGLAPSPDSLSQANRPSNRPPSPPPPSIRPLGPTYEDPIRAYVMGQVRELVSTSEVGSEQQLLARFIMEECIVTADFIKDATDAEALAFAYREFKKKVTDLSKQLEADGKENKVRSKATGSVVLVNGSARASVAGSVQGGGGGGGATTCLTVEASEVERVEVLPSAVSSPPPLPLLPPGVEPDPSEATHLPYSPFAEIQPDESSRVAREDDDASVAKSMRSTKSRKSNKSYKSFLRQPTLPFSLQHTASHPLEDAMDSPGGGGDEAKGDCSGPAVFNQSERDQITTLGLR